MLLAIIIACCERQLALIERLAKFNSITPKNAKAERKHYGDLLKDGRDRLRKAKLKKK